MHVFWLHVEQGSSHRLRAVSLMAVAVTLPTMLLRPHYIPIPDKDEPGPVLGCLHLFVRAKRNKQVTTAAWKQADRTQRETQ